MLTLPAAAALLAAITSSAAAQSDQRIVVPLSDPSRPATLEVSLFNGSISVTAYDGNEIVIVTNDGRDDEPPRPDREGLRRIPNTAIGLTAEERDNTVSIALDWNRRGVDLDVSVPRRTSVRARSVNGDVTVRGVTGDHELTNVNSPITAAEISGSAVVGTTNGNVQISFSEITAGKAMSFSSFNGDVEVAFPASLAADLRINAGRGEVLTDFDVELQSQPSVVESSGGAGRYRVRMEREVRAVVGGGGTEITFKTFNGDIIIRKR
jgi:hypothetical protein